MRLLLHLSLTCCCVPLTGGGRHKVVDEGKMRKVSGRLFADPASSANPRWVHGVGAQGWPCRLRLGLELHACLLQRWAQVAARHGCQVWGLGL